MLAIATPITSSPASSYSLTVNRRVFINEWGVVAINDTVTVRNLGTEPVTGILMGIPREYASDLKYVSSTDQNKLPVTIDRDVTPSLSIYWMRFNFPSPVLPQKSCNFSSVMVVDNVLNYVQGTFVYRFADAPSFSTAADVCNATVLLPAGSGVFLPENSTFAEETIGGMPALVHTFKPLEPNRAQSLSFNFTSVSIQFLDVGSVERDISFAEDGSILVSDTYAIRNLAASITSLTIPLAKNASNVMAYDPAGPLWTQPQDTTQPAVSPRYGTFRGNENFTFTLKYHMPGSGYIRQLRWWGLYNFTFDLFTYHPWMVQNLTVRIFLDKGMTLEKTTQHPNSTYTDHERTVLLYDITGVTPLNDLTFKMEYKYVSFWAAYAPINWLVAIEGILCVFLIASRGRKVGPAAVAPVEAIRRFVSMYDERIALRLEIDKIEEDMTRGAVSKHDYRRRRKAIDQRLDEINRSLTSVKDQLRSAAARYDEVIRKMDKAEAEIGAAKASEAQIRAQYRAGKINKDVYETVVADARKRIAKARETLESTTIALREEAR
jgi:hypothetical protein